jgi:hypothetical protein
MAVVGFALSTAACDDKKPKQPETSKTSEASKEVTDTEPDADEAKIVTEEGPQPTDDTVIASAGDLEVTMGDFAKASQISLLFAPGGVTELPPERLALPHVHMTMTRSLLSQEAILKEVERRGITPDEKALVKWLTDHEKLGEYGELMDKPDILRARLKPLGLTRADLLDVARAEVATDRLAEALLKEVDDDEVWDVYRREKTTRTVAMVSATNLPTSEELDEYVGDHAAEIDEYFQKNPNRFRVPRRVTVHLVRPTPGEEVDDETMKKAADELRQGIQPVTVARHLDLEHQLNVNMVKGENPEAFGSKRGDVGWVPDGPRGAIAWKVVDFQPSRLPEMSRPLRREIAAEMIRTQDLAPSVEAKLSEALRQIRKTDMKDEGAVDRLEKQLESGGDIAFEITTFPDAPNGVLPGHGLAEEVLEAAFETDVGESAGPLLSREKGYAFLVLDKAVASKKQFRANLEGNRKAYLDALRPRVVQMWTQRKLNEMDARVDVKPLRIRYGVLQKD